LNRHAELDLCLKLLILAAVCDAFGGGLIDFGLVFDAPDIVKVNGIRAVHHCELPIARGRRMGRGYQNVGSELALRQLAGPSRLLACCQSWMKK
jgi:hypothetical protein